MSEKDQRQPVEPTREPSPDRFLNLLSEVSGMKQLGDFTKGVSETVPGREAKLAGVVGIIVVGSATNPAFSPKDVDVMLVLSKHPNSKAISFAEDLQMSFDQAYSRSIGKFRWGRLDNLGYLTLDSNEADFSGLHPLHLQAILESPVEPLVLAFDQVSAEQISQAVHFITASK